MKLLSSLLVFTFVLTTGQGFFIKPAVDFYKAKLDFLVSLFGGRKLERSGYGHQTPTIVNVYNAPHPAQPNTVYLGPQPTYQPRNVYHSAQPTMEKNIYHSPEPTHRPRNVYQAPQPSNVYNAPQKTTTTRYVYNNPNITTSSTFYASKITTPSSIYHAPQPTIPSTV